MIKIDTINKKILEILQQNATITNTELSNLVGLSPATTLERVRKLEKAGIINKYVAIIDYEKLDRNITAFVEIFIKDHSSTAIQEFTREIKKIPEVLECYYITGDKDFLLKVITTDIKSYRKFAMEKLAGIPNIGRINTMFVLSTEKIHTHITIE